MPFPFLRMPVFLDPSAGPVLFAVDLSVFLRCQMSTIRSPVVMNLLMNILFTPFKIRALARRQLSVGNPFPNAMLLFRHTRIRCEAPAAR